LLGAGRGREGNGKNTDREERDSPVCGAEFGRVAKKKRVRLRRAVKQSTGSIYGGQFAISHNFQP